MAQNKELRKIKKKYGEKFSKLCRELFPEILEEEGKLSEILENKFANNSSSLYYDIVQNEAEIRFRDLILEQYYKQKEKPQKSKEQEMKESPQTEEERKEIWGKRTREILANAGYDLYECKNEDDIQSFRKYYNRGETICTLDLGGRTISHYCFFAVKKDVEKIKREDFENPEKDDEYSKSVLAIQFNKEGQKRTVQIISRYNHTVPNPNCTLGNNLENLAPGLEESFSKYLGIHLNSIDEVQLNLPNYVLANNGKYYKYNMRINGVYYCPGNIIIRQGVAETIGSPGEGLLVDYFYINKKDKKIKLLNDNENYKDSFVNGLQEIEKIEVVKSNEGNISRVIKVFQKNSNEPVIIGIDKDNQIVKYRNINLEQVENHFMFGNRALTQLELPNLKKVGICFLHRNNTIENLELLNLEQLGDNALTYNKKIKKLKLPKVKQIGKAFLYFHNKNIEELELPNLEEVGDSFLCYNNKISQLKFPKLKEVGNGFLFTNNVIEKLELPNLKHIGSSFMYHNQKLISLKLPNVIKIGDSFLYNNNSLFFLRLPNVKVIGKNFMYHNKKLTSLEIPNVINMGEDSLHYNKNVKILKTKNRIQKTTSKDIAIADKKVMITTSQINKAGKLINNLIEKLKEKGKSK